MERLLVYTWPIGIPFWLAYAWAFVGEVPYMRRVRLSDVPKTDHWSLRVIMWTGMLSAFGAFASAIAFRTAAIPMAATLPVYVAGTVLVFASGLLRRHCFAMLGDRFTYAVQATADQKVVERGAYRYLRHPSYSAGFMLFAGIGLALGNWVSIAVCVIPMAFAYAYRISVEERLLCQTIGPAYIDYMKRTRRLIPFVF